MAVPRLLLLAVAAAAVLLLLRLVVAWAEPRMVFFPWRGVTVTPADRGIPYRALTIVTADGEHLHAWLLERAPTARTAAGDGAAAPALDADVLYLHGNGGNLSLWLDVLAGLHDRGLRVLAIDYRGYGASSGRPSEAGLLRDTEAAVEAFRRLRRPDVPAVYWGRSLGATFAAYAARLARPDALILESPFPDKAAVIRRDPVLRFFNLFASRAPRCGHRFGRKRLASQELTRDSPRPLEECYRVANGLHVKTMPLNIRNAEAEQLAAELARCTGETKTQAVIKALRERLERVRRERVGRRLADELEHIARHCASLPVLDARPADEILGYDERGLPR
ncbi:MAG TPA: type II toxin-antitoxin system VapB family antitoxin [Vicinamibacterales bacterium]|nr:type II toxin-antitoxin system VapB family antitoxin [Vicinamibacterales bacterium]